MKRIESMLFWFFFIIYLEMVIKISFFHQFINFNFVYVLLFTIPASLLLHLLTTIFNEKINKIISYIFVISITIIYVAQLIYYKTYLSIFSIYSVGEAGQIVEFADTVFKIMLRNMIPIILLLIPIFIFIFLNRYFMYYQKRNYLHEIILLMTIILFQAGTNFILYLSKDEMYSPKELYYYIHSPTLSTEKLGLMTTMRLDFKRLVFGFTEHPHFVSKVDKNKDKDNIETDKKIEYNVMNIDFDKLNASESDTTIINMNTYFKDIKPTKKNDYTGMFKGKNLIVLLAESFHPIAIDEYLTPNLYMMQQKGFKFTNFYTPIFPVSTCDGEYITATSLIPKEGVWSAYRSNSNYFPFVLGNAFKNIGYKSMAFHDHSATYYHRDTYVTNWGYEYYACKRGLNINCKQWPESDLEMIDASYNMYIDNSPFMTYYVTVSGHLRYNLYNSMAHKNWSLVKNLPYSESVKAYIACNIELDKAVGKLIEYLRQKGILEDTVIAISADHYPYGLTLDEINEKSSFTRDDNFDKHKMAFLLWNSEMKPVTIDKYASSIDVLPTLLNLFGVEYDSRLLMGKDILSDAEQYVMFSNRSFISDKGRHSSITRNFYNNSGEKINMNQSYIDNINQIIYDRFYMSRLIIEKDYYRHIFNQ